MQFLVRRSFLQQLLGRKTSEGIREKLLREFFLGGLPTEKFEFSFVEQQQGATDLLTPARSA